MNLTRPLVALDIESTGPKPETDRVIELGLVRLAPDGERTVRRWLIHPGREIPAESTKVHSITDAMVAHAPRFEAVAAEIAAELSGVDLTGYNVRGFDIPILRREFELAAVPWPCEGARVIDSYVVFKERERHTLGNAVRRYCGREHANAHSATSDAEAALDVLFGQLAHYADLPRSVEELDLASGGRQPSWATELGHLRWGEDGDLYVAFGRHDGARLIDMDDGFIRWVLERDFPADVKALMRAVRNGGRPRAPGAPPVPDEPSDDPDDHWRDDDEDIPF
jgi:DNA polymerase-3 subunit epsilon